MAQRSMYEIKDIASVAWIVLGAVGGGVKVLVQLLGMENLPTRSRILWLLSANMLVSAFSGYMGALIATTVTPDDNFHVISAGIAGYLGVAALDFFSEYFKKRIK